MPLAIRLYQKWTFKEMARNLSIFVFFTWLAIGFSASLWVLGAVLLLSGVSKVFEYFVSNELNKEVSADQRATILSIKGLSMNLGYGGIGILYSLFLYGTRLAGQDFPQGEMAYTLPYFPAYFLLLFVCLFLFSKKKFFISQPKSSS